MHATADAIIVHRATKPDEVSMGVHYMSLVSTAAGTAVADSIKASQHSILEESMVHMTALIFRLENFNCLSLCDPTRTLGMMLDDQASEGLTDDQAYIQGQTGVWARSTAGAFHGHDMCLGPSG
jgi:hypothetical protein